jgi:hypothetical protein
MRGKNEKKTAEVFVSIKVSEEKQGEAQNSPLSINVFEPADFLPTSH